MKLGRWTKGEELSQMEKVFTSSSKGFINKHKEDLEILIDNNKVIVNYGESRGEFILEDDSYVHDYGNLYKADMITKIVNQLMKDIIKNLPLKQWENLMMLFLLLKTVMNL